MSSSGRPLLAAVIGTGKRQAALVAGTHSDEPVGPETLRLIVTSALRRDYALKNLLRRWTLWIVPHLNPDGEQENFEWIARWPSVEAYLRCVLREPPGRDLEFGFPKMRQENAVLTAFLTHAAPVRLYASLHGMGFGEGAQLLIDRSWVTRTRLMQSAFAREASLCGVGLHDEDRFGEKGFHYIGAGFATTPTGVAMRQHFRVKGDEVTAALFQDSSMEQAACTAPDPCAPLCLVTEVPLFRLDNNRGSYRNFREQLPALILQAQRSKGIADELVSFGVEPVDPRVTIRLQLRAIELGLATTEDDSLVLH